jgi:CDP-glucose 4,6-dehydratase
MPDSFWRDRNVLVTGGTGLLGSWLAEALLAREAHVVGIIRDRVPRSRLVSDRVIERIDVVWGAVEDCLLVERALNEYEIQTVFHLAAQTIVGIANRDPLSTFESNIRGTWSVLEACRRVPTVGQIVVASSDKAYGEHAGLPYSETHALRGRHPYDVSKSCADLIAQAYWQTFGLPVAVTRCGNLFGGGDLNWNRIVPGTIRSVIRGEPPVIRSDGNYLRDYLYVEDAVHAYLLLAEAQAGGALNGQAFNISYEAPQSVTALVERILQIMGRRDLRPKVLNEASNEIREQYLSAAKARETLRWKPLYDMDEGLRRTIAWYRDFFSREERE